MTMKTKVAELSVHERKICMMLRQLFTVFVLDKEAEEKLACRYAEELAECYPAEIGLKRFEFVVKKCIHTCKRFPSIADILEVGEWQDYSKMKL